MQPSFLIMDFYRVEDHISTKKIAYFQPLIQRRNKRFK